MADSNWFPTTNQYIWSTTKIILNSQNVANNTSNVTVQVWVFRSNSGYTTYGTGNCYIYINGPQFTSSITSDQKITSTPICIYSGTFDIAHNADGTKTLNTSQHIDHSMFSSTGWGDFNYTLPTIPRASSGTLASDTIDCNGTNALQLTINRASSTFLHEVIFNFGSYSQTYENVGTSQSFAPPMSWLNAIPNSLKGWGTVTINTFSGSTFIGQTVINFYLNVPASVVPTIGGFTATRVDNDVPSGWGVYVQNHSKCTLAVTGAAGAYGSTIKTYGITGGGYSASGTASSITTDPITLAGSVTFTATVTDSRGRTATATVTITVVAYAVPSIASSAIARCLSNGTADEDGTYISVLCDYNASTVSGHNTITATAQFRVSGATSWSSLGSFSDNVKATLGAGAVSVDSAYDVLLTIADYWKSATFQTSIPTGFATMDFLKGGKGIAFGKVADTADLFECDFPAQFNAGVASPDVAGNRGAWGAATGGSFEAAVGADSAAYAALLGLSTAGVRKYALEFLGTGAGSSQLRLYNGAQYLGMAPGEITCNLGWTYPRGIVNCRLLWNSSTGIAAPGATATLDETSANFTFLVFVYNDNDNNQRIGFGRPGFGNVTLDSMMMSSSACWIKTAFVGISGATITINNALEYSVYDHTTTQVGHLTIKEIWGISL